MSKKTNFSGTITANKQKCETCENKDECTQKLMNYTGNIANVIEGSCGNTDNGGNNGQLCDM